MTDAAKLIHLAGYLCAGGTCLSAGMFLAEQISLAMFGGMFAGMVGAFHVAMRLAENQHSRFMREMEDVNTRIQMSNAEIERVINGAMLQ